LAQLCQEVMSMRLAPCPQSDMEETGASGKVEQGRLENTKSQV